ncbi:hypothetical protein [Flavobacterium hercynium]|uniref:Uncharacterized protein n=1 Tax=Flavobacterium hercynium TaxID=387094 RepID=A0A226GY02_9FLAO|nr:hypothetical protein [Flavobacterium hercynium]OXA86872.1 hypothetical protein B0A66_17020 [Flavobacterium hercynium]SMP12875.1 hypothetical protein SAMN06265346_103284 [Flavobacterium hercynium]
MKTVIKSKIAFLFIIIGLSFSCKKNDTIPVDSDLYVDSTVTTVDSVNATVDTLGIATDTTMVSDTIAKPIK